MFKSDAGAASLDRPYVRNKEYHMSWNTVSAYYLYIVFIVKLKKKRALKLTYYVDFYLKFLIVSIYYLPRPEFYNDSLKSQISLGLSGIKMASDFYSPIFQKYRTRKARP